MVVFLSWHNSLPGFISEVYKKLTLPKSFISTNFVKGLNDTSLMAAPNSYKVNTDYEVINLLKKLNPSHIVVWNVDFNDDKRGYQVSLITLIKSALPKIKFVYCEHGWLPQNATFSMDNLGSNGSSSITLRNDIPKKPTLQAVYNKRLHYIDASNVVSETDYLYLPLQLNTDTQITKYSPHFKDMVDFINHVSTLFPSKRIVVKAHPKDTPNNIKRYKSLCHKLSNTKFVMDLNNIGWCRYSKGVIAINSTVINEALLFNKPVMTYGLNTFSGKGVTYEINDIKDIEKQKAFIDWQPNENIIEEYVCWILSLQFDRRNPNMKKVLEYFK